MMRALDNHDPDWWQRVDTTILDQPCGGIATQLFGDSDSPVEIPAGRDWPFEVEIRRQAALILEDVALMGIDITPQLLRYMARRVTCLSR